MVILVLGVTGCNAEDSGTNTFNMYCSEDEDEVTETQEVGVRTVISQQIVQVVIAMVASRAGAWPFPHATEVTAPLWSRSVDTQRKVQRQRRLSLTEIMWKLPNEVCSVARMEHVVLVKCYFRCCLESMA